MGHPSPLPGGTQFEIVVPVRNEERELTDHVTRLLGYLNSSFPCGWLVTVADNGSTDACVVASMDVDLSTDLRALFPLVATLLSGHSDVAIGSRLTGGSRMNILATALADLRGIWRLRWGLLTGSLSVPALGGARPVLLDQTIGGSAR